MASPVSKFDAVTIGEAARRVGLTARAIRYYERVGLIDASPRSKRNYRLYNNEALHDLRSIARSRAIGMSVADIRAVRYEARLQTREDGRTGLLRKQLKLTEARIRELLSVRRELRRQLGEKSFDPKPARAVRSSVGARNLPARR